MNNIHKTSIIDKRAQIGENVIIGPYSIIEHNVKIGNGNIIHPYVHIKSGSTIGNNNGEILFTYTWN